MKKTIIVMAILATGVIADNARCEGLLTDIRGNSDRLSTYYRSGDNGKVRQVMQNTFRIATQAMFVCDDERNKDDLENILNMLGTELGI